MLGGNTDPAKSLDPWKKPLPLGQRHVWGSPYILEGNGCEFGNDLFLLGNGRSKVLVPSEDGVWEGSQIPRDPESARIPLKVGQSFPGSI